MKHITAEAAEAEPLRDRLFSRPARPMSPATRAAFARIEAQRIERKPEQKPVSYTHLTLPTSDLV